jgi:hypothetical protein
LRMNRAAFPAASTCFAYSWNELLVSKGPPFRTWAT